MSPLSHNFRLRAHFGTAVIVQHAKLTSRPPGGGSKCGAIRHFRNQQPSLHPARLNRARLPFTTGISTTLFTCCTPLKHPNLDLLGVVHCFCTSVCLRLRYLVSFRDVRHPFLYCWFISLNSTCVVSTAFWTFPVARQVPVSLSSALLEHPPLRRTAGTVLGLSELVRMTSTSFSVNWTSGICAVF